MLSPPRALRILFLGPDGVAHVTRWVRFLQERGHEVLLASAHQIPHDEPCGGVPLLPHRGSRPVDMWGVLRAASAARRIAQRFRPDVTVSYNLTSYGVIAAAAGVRPHVCATAGGDVLIDPFDNWSRRALIRAALAFVRRRSDRLLAWAPHIRDELVSRGVPEASVFVQPRGVLLDLFPFRPPRDRGRGEPLRIFSNRMLKPLYGVDVLVRALARLKSESVPFEARICGEGVSRKELESLVESLSLTGDVEFVGTVAAAKMPQHLAWTDVYVSTSYTDGASSSLFEAMATGRIAVVSDLPANRPFVEPGRSGILFPPGDDVSLFRALQTLAVDSWRSLSGGTRARSIAEEKLDYRRNMVRIEGILQVAAGQDDDRRLST